MNQRLARQGLHACREARGRLVMRQDKIRILLHEALMEEERDDEVLHLPDDLSYGSIGSLDPDAQLHW